MAKNTAASEIFKTSEIAKKRMTPIGIAAIIIALVIAIWAATVTVNFVISRKTRPDTKWYSRDRDASEFTISTDRELAGLSQIVNGTWGKKPKRDNFTGKTVKLANNISLSVYDNWVPIGNYFVDTGNVFSGTFDGGNHIISNLTVNRSNADYQGLFGRVDNGGIVKDIGLDSANVTGRSHVGGVAGVINAESKAIGCYFVGNISGNITVGGIAGAIGNNSNLIDSYSKAALVGDSIAGGVVGLVFSGSEVTNSYFEGVISGNFMTGGVVGLLRDGSRMDGSYANGSVSGNIIAGGAAGVVEDNSDITRSYSESKVNGRSTIGGVVGHLRNNGGITDSYSKGNVNGSIAVGGVAGSVDFNSYVTGSHSAGAITSDRDVGVGGIAGQIRKNSRVVGSYSLGAVRGNRQVGGVVGLVLDSSDVASSYAVGAVSGNRYVGGVAGLVSGGSRVISSYATGAVSGTDNAGSIGGLVGGIEKKSRIINSAALNSEVTGNGANIERVVGEFPAGNILLNNVAFAEMKNNTGNTEWRNKGATVRGGADITKAVIARDDTIGGRFKSADGWTVKNGRLPGLGGETVRLPAHLRMAGYIDQDSVNGIATPTTVAPPANVVQTPPPVNTIQTPPAVESTQPIAKTTTSPAGSERITPPAPAPSQITKATPQPSVETERAIPTAPITKTTPPPATPAPPVAKATPPSAAPVPTATAPVRTRASIRPTIVSNIGSISYAYVRRLSENPNLQGKVDVKFLIDQSGQVVAASIAGSTLGDPMLENFIVETVKNWNFGSIDTPGVAEVIYPFVLAP